jgi:transposase
MEFKNFIGIDISKTTLDVCLIGKNGAEVYLKWDNEEATIKKELASLYKKHGLGFPGTLICAESTGHYGNKLIAACGALNACLWIESAVEILHSQGMTRGKSDKTDAFRIAVYAKRFSDKAKLRKAPLKSIELLERLGSERENLVRDIAKHKGQIKQEEGFFDHDYFKKKKKRLEKLIKENEKILTEAEREIEESGEGLKKNMEIMTSITGVGPKTALATIVATGNFEKFDDPRKFACHAGCAPFKYQSGTSLSSKNKVSQKANKKLKALFHMAALSAIRAKGEFKDYFERKVKEGKNKMSVVNAVRSKLIHRIFALVKQNRKYEKIYTHLLV